MNDNYVSSNSNNLNFKINIAKLLHENFQSQSSQAYRKNYIFGDDEKNHPKLKPLIIYDDITDRQQSTSSSTSSSQFQNIMNKKLTQSTEADNQSENTFSFYTIIDKYYDYYNNNQIKQSQIVEISQQPIQKIERLYTEYNEQFKTSKKQGKNQLKNKNKTSGTKKLNSSCKQKNKQSL